MAACAKPGDNQSEEPTHLAHGGSGSSRYTSRTSLGEIYSIPTAVLHAAPLTAHWIAQSVPNPVLVGPDAESVQSVRAVA